MFFMYLRQFVHDFWGDFGSVNVFKFATAGQWGQINWKVLFRIGWNADRALDSQDLATKTLLLKMFIVFLCYSTEGPVALPVFGPIKKTGL